MSKAAEARTWAPGTLRGIIDSLYTPFSGPGGEHIDENAFRTLIGHCLGSLGHDGIWVGGLVGEAWAMSLAERKQILEIAVDEVRSVKPGALIEACPVSTNVLETVELTRHAAETGADICFLIPPFFEASGYEATRELFRYVVPRTDIALGLFNTPAAKWILTPAECRAPRRRVSGNLRCEKWDVQAVCFRCIAPTRTGTGHLGMRHAGLPCRVSPPGDKRARHSRRIGVLV